VRYELNYVLFRGNSATILKAPRAVKEQNMVVCRVGLGTKNHSAGESQQQFSSQSVFKGLKKQLTAMKFDLKSSCIFPRAFISRQDGHLSDN
jgi:glutaminase